MESYLVLTSHYISPDGNLVTQLLDAHRFTERHTSNAIAVCLDGIIQRWGLSGKVHCAVTDNGANMDAAIRKLSLRHMPCFTHILNLIVKDSLAAVADLEEIREKILKPFFVVMEEMSAEKHVTASKVIILVNKDFATELKMYLAVPDIDRRQCPLQVSDSPI
ncbi:UNVERIFIED_CONTAM: hypothetical protein FKN15_012440 [Acipenser sinensis]